MYMNGLTETKLQEPYQTSTEQNITKHKKDKKFKPQNLT